MLSLGVNKLIKVLLLFIRCAKLDSVDDNNICQILNFVFAFTVVVTQ